jgi:hypothetical protein
MRVNDEELRQMRVAADAVALKSLFFWQCQVIQGLLMLLPSEQQTLHVKTMLRELSENRIDYMQMTFPEKSAAESDLLAAEVQEASDRWAKEFQACLAPFLEVK